MVTFNWLWETYSRLSRWSTARGSGLSLTGPTKVKACVFSIRWKGEHLVDFVVSLYFTSLCCNALCSRKVSRSTFWLASSNVSKIWYLHHFSCLILNPDSPIFSKQSINTTKSIKIIFFKFNIKFGNVVSTSAQRCQTFWHPKLIRVTIFLSG